MDALHELGMHVTFQRPSMASAFGLGLVHHYMNITMVALAVKVGWSVYRQKKLAELVKFSNFTSSEVYYWNYVTNRTVTYSSLLCACVSTEQRCQDNSLSPTARLSAVQW